MDYLREKVSGPKNRFKDDGYNLDLTYVCNRIIAMSFPASGFETLYRNNIQQVVDLIKKKHNSDYLIINLSGRKYDYQKFDNKVVDYEWEDHHSPAIDTLFQICQKIHVFLKSNIKNVVVIHCLAGKGRTGTIICCYLIYSGKFKSTEEAFQYYSKKRFQKEGLGVNQPCQVRYVNYFFDILTKKNFYPTNKYINRIELIQRPNFGNSSFSPFIEVYDVHKKEMLITTEQGYWEQKVFDNKQENFTLNIKQVKLIPGDVLIKLKDKGITNKSILRVSFNSAFIPSSNVLEFKLKEISPSQLSKDKRFPSNFALKIYFDTPCQCTENTPFEKKCQQCQIDLENQYKGWKKIYDIVDNYKVPSEEEQNELLFGSQQNDVQQILNAKNQQNEEKEQNNSDLSGENEGK